MSESIDDKTAVLTNEVVIWRGVWPFRRRQVVPVKLHFRFRGEVTFYDVKLEILQEAAARKWWSPPPHS